MIRIIPGDTLHGIARLYLKDPSRWPELLKYNVIKSGDPNLIHPGDKLLVPVKEIKKAMRAAYLIETINKVEYRPRGEVVFRPAQLNQKVFYEDTIRTFDYSYAKVLYPTKDVLKISPNSLVVIRPKEIDHEVNLIKGEIYARKARVLTKSATIEPKGESIFKAKVDKGKTTEVEVYGGSVDVVAQGKKIEVAKGFASKIELGKIPLPPREIKLPSPQELQKLKMDLTIPTTFNIPKIKIEDLGRLKPQEINIEKELETARKKRRKIIGVEIALDEYFAQIVLSGRIDEIKPAIGNLVDGRYYYRIKYLEPLTKKMSYSPVKSFLIDRKHEDVEVTIIYPPEGAVIYDEFVEVKGSVSGDVESITVDSVNVDIFKDGSFSRIIYLPMGPHDIEIVSRDKLGNTKRFTRRVVRKQKKRTFWEKIFGG
ncbi:MAG: FecR domain-containing protein [Elusimicrobia bacterium]|nr:FecR domain-containing protein [Elusimicrobiota bacterium]